MVTAPDSSERPASEEVHGIDSGVLRGDTSVTGAASVAVIGGSSRTRKASVEGVITGTSPDHLMRARGQRVRGMGKRSKARI
jgi:hypothetical protein